MTRPPTMGAAMRFITSAPVPVDHMMGSRPMHGREHGHGLGPDALHRAVDDGLDEVAAGPQQPALLPASSWERSRKRSMKTPVSASRPMSAIMPTQTAMETL